MTYEYKEPLQNGYRKIKVSKSLHNSVFKYRKRTLWKSLFTKHEYYANDWCIRVEVFPTLFAKLIVLTSFPFLLLLHGVSNYSEIKNEVYSFCNPKKSGEFAVDDITGDQYKKIISKI